MKAPIWGAKIKCAICGNPLVFDPDMRLIRCAKVGCKERGIAYKAPVIELERANA